MWACTGEAGALPLDLGGERRLQSSEILIGRRYGMRLKVAVGEPFIEANVIRMTRVG